ncbi:MAG: hypothetical protein A2857_01490 [Candidatus Levybacteria bacterium RIFCSPHIGHO2_01_FULL_36_15]|nr:MAG: hypothetical protein A2857_01490 [Candidatus Levybacteria bacterium RIFCSPHIGHO2_01_FULL_36_15]OGH39278.1 MAG: hypothetical protein A2905_00240 [Candidatus Levybacteria bacterium RIFCSPLOWO2_01_FULL_36_10]
MAEVTTAAETVAQSMVPEGTPAPGLTAEQQLNRSTAKRFNETFQTTKGEDPFAALREREQVDLHIDFDKQINARIGTEVTPVEMPVVGGVAGNAEGIRMNAAKNAAELGKRVQEKGYDALTDPAEKTALQNELINVINLRPAFDSLKPEEKTALAEAMLRNPDYQAKLGEILAGRVNVDMDPKLVEGLKEAAAKRDGAKEDVDKKRKEVTQKQEEVRRNKAELDRFTIDRDETLPDGRVVYVVGDKLSELRVREANETLDNTAVNDGLGELGLAGMTEDEIKELRTQVSEKMKNGTFDLAAAPYEEQVMSNVITHEQSLDRLEDLRDERVVLMQDEARLTKEITTLKDEVKALREAANKADDVFDTAKAAKDKQEEAYVQGLKNMFRDAGRGVLDDELKQRAESYKTWLTEQKKNAKDADTEKIARVMGSRYERAERKGKETIFKPNKQRIENDWQVIMTGVGPEGILRTTLTSGLEPNPADTPEEAARKEQEIARIDNRLKTDKDFVAQQSALIGGTILSYKMQTGKLYEGDIRVMLHKSWGEAAVNNAIASNEKIVKKFDEIYGDKAQFTGGRPGYVERMKRESGANWLKFLALLLAGTVAAGAMTARYTAQEGARGYQGP